MLAVPTKPALASPLKLAVGLTKWWGIMSRITASSIGASGALALFLVSACTMNTSVSEFRTDGFPDPVETSDLLDNYVFHAHGNVVRIIRHRNELGEETGTELYINGVKQDDGSFVLTPNALIYSDYSGNKSIAFSRSASDFVTASESFSANDTKAWNYTAIDYQYHVGKDGGAPKTTNGEDGTITYDGKAWNAKFGEVTLEGTLQGRNVSGSAKLGGMSGSFRGYDGVKTSEGEAGTTVKIVTDGVFVGDNGSSDSFVGSWSDVFDPPPPTTPSE